MYTTSDIIVTVRCYEELNDHLPHEYRKQPFTLKLPQNSTVEDILHKLHIPTEEVHLVLVNGEPTTFHHRLKHGDRVTLYPVFETIDISPLTDKLRRQDSTHRDITNN